MPWLSPAGSSGLLSSCAHMADLAVPMFRQSRFRVSVYGQVRPADAGAAGTVEVQNAAAGSSAFKTVASVPVTSANGIFTVDVPNTGGTWRLSWNGLTPSWLSAL